MDEDKNRGLGRTETSERLSRCWLGLRASTPVVEDDQDIGESNASVTINIGGAGVLFSFFDAKVGHAKSDVINVVIPIAVKVAKHVGFWDATSTVFWLSLVGIIRTVVDTVCGPITIGVGVFVPAPTSSGVGLIGISWATIVAVGDTIFVTVEIF